MSATYGKASWPIPSLTDAPNMTTAIQAIATQLDSFVRPKYASSAAQTAANPTPADGDTWYRTDQSMGYAYRGGNALTFGDSYNRIGVPLVPTLNQASLVWSSIPAYWEQLLLVYQLGSNGVGTVSETLAMRFNADTGAHYGYTNPTSGTSAAQTFGVAGYIFENGFANVWGAGFILIPNYASTTAQKYYAITSFQGDSTTSGTLGAQYGGGAWNSSSAAISSITLLPGASTGFKAGGEATLYGLG